MIHTVEIEHMTEINHTIEKDHIVEIDHETTTNMTIEMTTIDDYRDDNRRDRKVQKYKGRN